MTLTIQPINNNTTTFNGRIKSPKNINAPKKFFSKDAKTLNKTIEIAGWTLLIGGFLFGAVKGSSNAISKFAKRTSKTQEIIKRAPEEIPNYDSIAKEALLKQINK